MNFEVYFKQKQLRNNLDEILLYLYRYPEEFDRLYKLVFSCEEKVAWRMLWVCEKVCIHTPAWFDKRKIHQLINLILHTKHHGIQRIGLSILTKLPTPNHIHIELLNRLYDWMLSPKCTIGVQNLSMKLLYKYVQIDTYLMHEFALILDQANDVVFSSSFIASRKNILKKID